MINDLRQSLDLLDREARKNGYDSAKVDSIRLRIFREFVNRERERLSYEHTARGTGRGIVHQWTAVVDALITEAYRMVLLDNEGFAGECAIVALGGYGRGALNIASDVDILFLFDKSMPKSSPIVKGVLHLLWNLDFELGHGTRTVDEAIEFARADDVGQTAMIDARLLAGYEPPFRRFTEWYEDEFLRNGGNEFVELKVQQMRERRALHGSYAQVLEPNVRDSTGGLRDVHTMQWIMKAKRGTSALQSLVEHRVISKPDYRSLEAAVDLLWRVRNELHFRHKRKHDRIDFTMQPKIAESFRYEDTATHLAVEELMRDYYLAARDIVRISDSVAYHFTKRTSKVNQVTDIVRRRILSDGSVLVRGKILLPQKRKDFFKDKPSRLMSLFANMQKHGAIMSETASRAIYSELDLIDEQFRRDPKVARLFLGIMSSPDNLDDVLRRMHWTGVLGAYLPEFGRLTCLVQHDYYHAYTADEHSIITIERMTSLADSQDESLVARVYRGITNKALVHMAALLHDAGKSGGHGHAERGAEMSAEISERLGLSQHDQDLLAFLIARHLQLSHVSQRRDLDDMRMLEQLAQRFNDTTSLDMLYVLTWADMNATQAEPPSDWKMQLLDVLYTKLHAMIESRSVETPGTMTHVLESPQKYRDQLAERIGAEKADRHLIGMPRRYSLIHSLEEAERHARAADSLQSHKSVISEVEELKNGVRVTVYAYDRSHLLSDICGVLAVSDFNILYADAYTRSDGTVVDIFGVGGLTENGADRENQIARMEKAFQDVWSGSVSVPELIEQHRRRWARRKMLATDAQAHVVIDNQVSEHFTVLDVFTLDRIGLLHDISRTISTHGADIHMARIGTDGDRVADAFYITSEDGGKIVDEEQIQKLRIEVLAVLESPRP